MRKDPTTVRLILATLLVAATVLVPWDEGNKFNHPVSAFMIDGFYRFENYSFLYAIGIISLFVSLFKMAQSRMYFLLTFIGIVTVSAALLLYANDVIATDLLIKSGSIWLAFALIVLGSYSYILKKEKSV